MSMNPNQVRSGDGFSIVEMMVVMALVGVVLTIAGRWYVQQTTVVTGSMLISSRTQAKQYLIGAVRCEESLPAPCAPGELLDLYGQQVNGQRRTLVSKDIPTRIQLHTLRAECNATGTGILVRAARLRQDSPLTAEGAQHFRKHPVTGRTYDWDHQATLLFKNIELCTLSNDETNVTMKSTGIEDCENSDSDSSSGLYEGIAKCPADQKLIGGGVQCDYPGQVVSSGPTVTGGWKGQCCGSEDTSNWQGGKVYALCE